MEDQSIAQAVAEVIAAVRERGDAALLEFTERWDGVRLDAAALRVPVDAIARADADSEFARAFELAVARIRRFHEEVKPRSIEYEDSQGNRLGMRWTALDSVGLYIPGGKASYPSTLAMTAVPAQIAGVERIVVVSPPGPDGEVSEQVLLAARILGVDEVYRVGGAQAVAALAHGTETIPRVDKIFGPGNAYVAEAKKQVYGVAGIDLVAGPSEVVVVADATARPDWVAADILAQAEHDEDTCCTLLTTGDDIREAVLRQIAMQVDAAPRREVIQASLDRNGRFLVCESLEEAAARLNEIAPEHLSVQVADPWSFLPRVRNAGSIFLGPFSPVALGDYYAGTNHVLPTGRTARFASCLSVEDFMKRSNVCQASESFLRAEGRNVEVLAEGERLPAHAASVARRRATNDAGARTGFASVEPYHLVEESGEVKLNQNESPFDVPAELKDAIFQRMREVPWNRYHQVLPEKLRARIAEHNSLPSGQVFVGNGSNLVLQWIFECFGGPGRTAWIPAPSFSLFRMWGRLSETTLREYRLQQREREFVYPIDRIVEGIERHTPSLVLLNLPNNPTGSEMAEGDLERVVAATEAVGGWVVIDEAYREFSDIGHDRTQLVRDGRRALVLRTFSKALSAAGLRIGYVLAPALAADDLGKIVPPFHTSVFNAVAGLEFFDHAELFRERVDLLRRERERVSEALGRLPGVEVFRSWANFFLFRLEESEALRAALADKGILVRQPWSDPALSGCLRASVGTPEENDRFLAETEAFLKSRAR